MDIVKDFWSIEPLNYLVLTAHKVKYFAEFPRPN